MGQIQRLCLCACFVFLLLCVINGASAAGAQEELKTRPWWMDSISLTASMIAIVCISYAVIDLGVKHRAFGVVNLLAAMLIVFGMGMVEFDRGNLFFWLAAFIGIALIAIVIDLVIVAWFAGKLIRR